MECFLPFGTNCNGVYIKTIQQKISKNYSIQNASFWTSEADPVFLDVMIKNDLIVEMKSKIQFDGERFNAKNMILMLCGIDAQTHLRVPVQEQNETV